MTLQKILEDLHIRDLRELGAKFGVSARSKSDLIKKLLDAGITEDEVSAYPSMSEVRNFEDPKGVTIEERIKAYKIAKEYDLSWRTAHLGDRIRRELKLNMDPETIRKVSKYGVLFHEEIEAILKNRPDLFFPSRIMKPYKGPWYNVDVVLIDENGTLYLIEISYSSDTRMAIGQLLYYKKAFELRKKIRNLRLVLITNQVNQIIEEVCNELGIILIDVSPDSIEMKMDRLKRTKIRTILKGKKSDQNGYRPDYIIE
ncbi:hypothetical protein [Candidatus Pyrohabitans sp.]